MKTCENAEPFKSEKGIQADSKQEAALFSSLEFLNITYIPHLQYSDSVQGRSCDAYLNEHDIYVECYGGTYHPNSEGSRDYYASMLCKLNHFKICATHQRLLIVFRTAIYSPDFQSRLKESINILDNFPTTQILWRDMRV